MGHCPRPRHMMRRRRRRWWSPVTPPPRAETCLALTWRRSAGSPPSSRSPERNCCGTLDLVPHYSFAGCDAGVGMEPDLVVVPYIPYATTTDTAVLDWLRALPEQATIPVHLRRLAGGRRRLAVHAPAFLRPRRCPRDRRAHGLPVHAVPGRSDLGLHPRPQPVPSRHAECLSHRPHADWPGAARRGARGRTELDHRHLPTLHRVGCAGRGSRARVRAHRPWAGAAATR